MTEINLGPVYTRAAELIREGWTRYEFAEDATGVVCYCARGALYVAAMEAHGEPTPEDATEFYAMLDNISVEAEETYSLAAYRVSKVARDCAEYVGGLSHFNDEIASSAEDVAHVILGAEV